MGRRKLEIKRIEDKSSRRVTFSKRRTGLMKKARQLSVLCDVDVAVVVFSSGGKVYESCSGNTTRVEHILARYEKSCLVAEGECSTSRDNGKDSPTKFQTCKELLQTVDRLVEDTNNSEEFSVTDMTQLAEELNAALMQTRSRKTELLMDHISTLQQKIASAMDIIGGEDDGGGGPNDIATNHINSPPLVTLSLFNG